MFLTMTAILRHFVIIIFLVTAVYSLQTAASEETGCIQDRMAIGISYKYHIYFSFLPLLFLLSSLFLLMLLSMTFYDDPVQIIYVFL